MKRNETDNSSVSYTYTGRPQHCRKIVQNQPSAYLVGSTPKSELSVSTSQLPVKHSSLSYCSYNRHTSLPPQLPSPYRYSTSHSPSSSSTSSHSLQTFSQLSLSQYPHSSKRHASNLHETSPASHLFNATDPKVNSSSPSPSSSSPSPPSSSSPLASSSSLSPLSPLSSPSSTFVHVDEHPKNRKGFTFANEQRETYRFYNNTDAKITQNSPNLTTVETPEFKSHRFDTDTDVIIADDVKYDIHNRQQKTVIYSSFWVQKLCFKCHPGGKWSLWLPLFNTLLLVLLTAGLLIVLLVYQFQHIEKELDLSPSPASSSKLSRESITVQNNNKIGDKGHEVYHIKHGPTTKEKQPFEELDDFMRTLKISLSPSDEDKINKPRHQWHNKQKLVFAYHKQRYNISETPHTNQQSLPPFRIYRYRFNVTEILTFYYPDGAKITSRNPSQRVIQVHSDVSKNWVIEQNLEGFLNHSKLSTIILNKNLVSYRCCCKTQSWFLCDDGSVFQKYPPPLPSLASSSAFYSTLSSFNAKSSPRALSKPAIILTEKLSPPHDIKSVSLNRAWTQNNNWGKNQDTKQRRYQNELSAEKKDPFTVGDDDIFRQNGQFISCVLWQHQSYQTWNLLLYLGQKLEEAICTLELTVVRS